MPTDRQYALDQCYNQGNPAFCSFITRRPAQVGNLSAGSIQYSDVAVANTGGFGTEGVDLTASWSDKIGPGNLSGHLAYTGLRDLWQKATPEDEKNTDTGEVTAGNVTGTETDTSTYDAIGRRYYVGLRLPL